MDKFVVNTTPEKEHSVNRTIRMKPDLFKRLSELSETSGVSFNKIVNQCIEYALKNME